MSPVIRGEPRPGGNGQGRHRFPTSIPRLVADFVHGVLTPSPLATAVALLMVLGSIGSALVAISPAALAHASRTRLAAHAEDYDAIVTSAVLEFAHRPSRPPVLVVLGGSTTRASLTEDDLQREFADVAGPGSAVLKLCTSRQSLWESLLLAEALPRPLVGTVVVGVGPSLFSRGEESLAELAVSPRLGVRSRMLDEELAGRGFTVRPRTGVYAVDNAAFLLARRRAVLNAGLGGPAPAYLDSAYLAERDDVGERQWAARGTQVASRYPYVKANWAVNARVLDQLIASLRRTGLRVVLVETPVNPRFVTQYDVAGVGKWHQARMRDFASRRGVPYVILNDVAGLASSEFFDWAHLRNRGAARRCARALRVMLAPSDAPERTE